MLEQALTPMMKRCLKAIIPSLCMCSFLQRYKGIKTDTAAHISFVVLHTLGRASCFWLSRLISLFPALSGFPGSEGTTQNICFYSLPAIANDSLFENRSQFRHHTKTLLHFTVFTFFPLLPAHSVDCIQNFMNAVIFKSLLPQLSTEKSFSLPFLMLPASCCCSKQPFFFLGFSKLFLFFFFLLSQKIWTMPWTCLNHPIENSALVKYWVE